MVHPVAFLDVRLMRAVQRFDVPATYPVFHTIRTLTGSAGAVVAWVVGLVFLARRWWAPPAVALGVLPVGGVVNEGINLVIVECGQPHLETLARSSSSPEERSFPSGHVTGAVILYGLIFMAAGRLRSAPMRVLVRAGGDGASSRRRSHPDAGIALSGRCHRLC